MCHIGYVEGSIDLGKYKLALEPLVGVTASDPTASVPGPGASVPPASVPPASVPDAPVAASLGRLVRNNFAKNFGSRSWILDPSLPPRRLRFQFSSNKFFN